MSSTYDNDEDKWDSKSCSLIISQNSQDQWIMKTLIWDCNACYWTDIWENDYNS